MWSGGLKITGYELRGEAEAADRLRHQEGKVAAGPFPERKGLWRRLGWSIQPLRVAEIAVDGLSHVRKKRL